MRKGLLPIILLIFFRAGAQLPYTQSQFPVYLSDSNLVYAIGTGYAGNPDTLLLDIYKPAADANCLRPLLIMVHGGAWTGGSKRDASIVFIAREMASKGYVVATINYRLGMHKASNYSMYWACNNSVSAPCVYVADSHEVHRAIYRGMQDTRTAIRFMKARAAIDSTDVNNTFLAGESAGGFNVLAAAFMQDENQKPSSCYALPDAPAPDPDLLFCNPSGYSLSRPDLGSIGGKVQDTLQNSSVKGVASFYGALIDTSLLGAAITKPAVYLFHQGSDVVVHYNTGSILGRINAECFAPTSICQPYPHMPQAYGGEAIRQKLLSMGSAAPLFQAEILYNYSYGNDCFANGHSIDNLTLRSMQMASLFSVVIDLSGNDPANNCNLISVEEIADNEVMIYPNPVHRTFQIKAKRSLNIQELFIMDFSGRSWPCRLSGEKEFQVLIPESLNPGLYFLKIIQGKMVVIKKILVQ